MPQAPSAASSIYEWSKRHIAKYDLNSDGALTSNEWEKMLVKPIGADANSDGVITVDEFANFREESKQ